MQLLFCHDHRFIEGDSGAIFSPGQYSIRIWERYKEFFDTVTVVARSRKPHDQEILAGMNDVRDTGVSFRFLPSLSNPEAMLFKRREVSRSLAEAIQASDAVVVRIPSELGLLAASIADRLGKPWAVEMVACPWDALWNYGKLAAKFYAPIQSWRVRHCLARAPFSLYVTRNFLQQRYPTSGHSVAISDVEIAEASDDLRRRRIDRIRARHNPIILGQIGSISNKIKGLHTSLKALSSIEDRLGAFEFRVLGPGDPAPWKRMAGELGIGHKVIFEGTLPSGAPVLNWLDDIDIFIQPSFQEGLPRTVIEAMSRGCPVVASTAGGIPELLDASMLHSPGDWRSLAAMILDLAGDTKKLEGQSARNFRAAEDYSSERLYKVRHQFLHDFAKFAADNAGA